MIGDGRLGKPQKVSLRRGGGMSLRKKNFFAASLAQYRELCVGQTLFSQLSSKFFSFSLVFSSLVIAFSTF